MAVYIISSGNDFDLTQVEPDEAALVNDLSIIEGTPIYTLTVDGTEAEGVYSLANGAAKFKSTITVKNTYGDELGTLKLGEKVYIGKNDYTLTLTDDVLSVAINASTVTHANGDVLLDGTMPMARYMYGCVNTSISMILGYYDLYGYRGKDLSEVIEGDVELDTRGTGYYIYMMDDFDSNLGKANASRDYVERFFSKDSIEVINARTETETTPAEELPYSFVNDGAGPELRTDVWNCLADYLGTGQFWRGNSNLSATSPFDMLEAFLNDDTPYTVTDEATGIQRTIDEKYNSCLYGLYLYVRDKGYDLDRKTTKILQADVAGGEFTFDDYMKEIDAGRPVMVLVTGHAMVGYGYNAETREIIIDNCYQSDQRMVWDGVYDFAGERTLEAICTFGFMTSDADVDLAVSPFDEESGAAGKLIVTTAEGQTESADYCFAGSPLYLSFAVSNLGTSASGAFDVSIYCDGAEIENIPSLSLEPGAIKRMSDIPLAADFGVGLHSISVRIDPDNEIQEMYALNNSDERSVMVLKEGTNVVEGTKTVVSGEVSKDDYVMNGAGIQVLEGGTAEATLIQGKVTSRSLDGSKVEFAPGFVNVSMGGLIRNADVYEYGQLELSGTAEDLVIREHGNAVVSSGGIVSGASVDKNGTLDVESGGMLTGWIDVESGANIVFEEGGILNFDLTGTTAGAEASVNDLSIIKGTPTYTLTVSDEQEKGVYTLAEGAVGFDSTITVQSALGEEIGTITVGSELETENRRYTLNLVDDRLCLTCYALTVGQIIENETVRVAEYEVYRDTVVNEGGSLIVSSGATVTKTSINNGGLSVYSGGFATSTTINDGDMYVLSKGRAESVIVNSHGRLFIDGGTARDIHWTPCEGHVYVFLGGKASFASQYSGVYYGSNNHLLSNAVEMNSIKLGTKEEMNVMLDGITNNIELDGHLYVSSGGTANSTTIKSHGSMRIDSGGTACNIIVNDGGQLTIVDSGAMADNIMADSRAWLDFVVAPETYIAGTSNGTAFRIKDGYVSGYVIEHGSLDVFPGGIADDTVLSSGYYVISSKGIANITTVSGGSVIVSSGGTANSTTICSRGSMFVSSGGTMTGEMVFEKGARVSAYDGAALVFDISELTPDAEARVNNLSLIQGTPTYTLTVSKGQEKGLYTLADGAAGFNGTITVKNKNTYIKPYGTLAVGSSLDADGFRYTLNLEDENLLLTCISLHISQGIGSRTSVTEYEFYCDARISGGGSMIILSGGIADNTRTNNRGSMLISSGGVANNTLIKGSARESESNPTALTVFSGGTANNTIISGGRIYVSSGGTANGIAVTSGGRIYVSSGGTALDVDWTPCEGDLYLDGGHVTFVSHYSGVYCGSDYHLLSHAEKMDSVVLGYREEMNVLNDGIANNTTLSQGCHMSVSLGGEINYTTVFSNSYVDILSGGVANSTILSKGSMIISSGGIANDTIVYGKNYFGALPGGIIRNATITSGGSVEIWSGGKITGLMTFESGAKVSAERNGGAILDFDISELTPEAGARVNNLAIIQGTPTYTLTVSDTQAGGIYTLAEGAASFNSTITVQNTLGETLGTLTVGETLTIDKTNYLLTNENGVLSVTVSDGGTPAKPKWTYMVYMAADSNIGTSALYDIIGMQQAEVDSEIDIYVLADRCAVDAGYPDEIVTVNGTYKWDSLWPETRVGKITYSPDLTVTVDWESWGELDTASSETLKRFVDWVQEESPAENYGLILWDHGEEDGELCWDLTTDPNWNACFKVSEVSDLLNEKGNIPIVIFNNCLLASEIVATQLAGSTEVIVASEPVSMGESTYNYHAFFNTITAGMTPQEMAEIMVRNVISPGMLTMLSSIDVRDSRLGDALEALADAVAEADNDADKTVLTNAMLKAYQDGFCYTGSLVQQSDLGYMIQQAMADGSFDNTSEGFKKALADVKTVLEEVVLAVRSVPVKRGTGIAYCNTIATLLQCAVTGRTPEKMDSLIKSHIISSYKSNPLWGGLLYDLGSTFLNRNADQLFRPASFHVIDIEGLVEGRTVAAMDLGCFSGMGEQNYGIALIGDAFCRIVITDEDKSTGIISVGNESGKEIKVSLLAADGSIVVAENTNGIDFENLAPGDYYIRLQGETNCDVTVTFDANWMTGVDRFDYAGSGQNLPGVNGNGSIDTATILDAGYYTGLLTGKGDTDFYRVGNIHTEQYTVVINGREDWTVAEYDENGILVREGQYSELDNYITLTMDSMNYLLVEGTADPSKQEVNRYFLNIFKNKNGSGGVVQLDDLTGSKDEVSWESSTISEYVLECSTDGFEHVLQYTTNGTAVDLLNLPAGTYQWRVKANMDSAEWNDGNEIVSDNTNTAPKVFRSKADASDDIFFAMPVGTWDNIYYAQNVGSVNDWTGTNEIVSANGKGRIQDLFFGSADPSTLCLTDSENGDALFLDDMYTGLPEDIEDNTGRLFRLQSIMAGAGDDIIDMTSQRFEYSDGNLSIFGGDGDDIIWASKGRNSLYGDAGNDRIVGASSNDVIVGGIGNDRMHGGGGDDIFTFCKNWGTDTVEQLGTGKVTLWFASGDESKWNAETLTYTDGDNTVTVKGVTSVTLKFGGVGDDAAMFAMLSEAGAFKEFTSQKIFEESKGLLA